MSYTLFVTDGDIEALMGAIKRDDQLEQNKKLVTVKRKLAAARHAAPPRQETSKYGWERLLRGESPIAVPAPAGISLDALHRVAHNWASYHKLRVATRQIDGKLHVWLVGRKA